MVDSSIIEASGINGMPIRVGTAVKYINTDTVGFVTGLKKDTDGVWALVDKTDLYYKVETLVVTEIEIRKEEKEHEITATDALDYIKKQAKMMDSQDTKGIHGVGGG